MSVMPVSAPKPTPRKPAKKSGDEKPAERVVAENRKARHDYEIIDTLECGIALVGSEVKSLRGGRMSIEEAYGRVDGNEVWLLTRWSDEEMGLIIGRITITLSVPGRLPMGSFAVDSESESELD